MTALVLVALAVAVDSFAAAAALGLAGPTRRRKLEIALVFGLFEGGMPLIGLLLGGQLTPMLGGAARPAGAALLGLAGAYQVAGEFLPRRRNGSLHGWRARLWLSAVALSVDNLVVGLALGTYNVPVPAALGTFAAAGCGLSLLGVELGSRAGRLLDRMSLPGRLAKLDLADLGEITAGGLLIVIAVLLGLGVL